MMGIKKGFTLIETLIAIALLTMCIIGFLQALNVAMLGTDKVKQTNAAAELARSQMEYIQQRDYDCNASSIPDLYGYVPEIPSGFSTANINTTVSNVSGTDYRAIQQITVNVSYYYDTNYIEITDYKTPRLGSILTNGSQGWPISKKVDIPMLPCVFRLLFWWVCGTPGERWGYYYTFETGTTTGQPGPISINWKVDQCFEFKTFYLYLYAPTARNKFPTADKGLIRMEPPTSGCLSVVKSRWYEGDGREVCDIDMTNLAPGIYTVYYFNSGLGPETAVDLPPSKSTITYVK